MALCKESLWVQELFRLQDLNQNGMLEEAIEAI